MSNVVSFARARAVTSNHVFEAHDLDDPTKPYFLDVFRDEDDMGVYVNFCEPTADPGIAKMRDMMWLDADRCEEFGRALLSAAQVIREADFKAAGEGE